MLLMKKKKNGILELIQLYENQVDNNNLDFDGVAQNDSENLQKMGNVDLSFHSKGNDSEIKDNFS